LETCAVEIFKKIGRKNLQEKSKAGRNALADLKNSLANKNVQS